MEDLISINEAAEHGIDRLKKPVWAMEEDHIKIDIIDGKPGPWVKLFSTCNKAINGRDPVAMVIFEVDIKEKVYSEYKGILPDSDEYTTKARQFEDND